MGVTRVHVLSTSIAIQSKSNPLRHEHHQLVQKIRLLQRQNSRAEEELLQILSSQRRRWTGSKKMVGFFYIVGLLDFL
jgi:hypothetical protein